MTAVGDTDGIPEDFDWGYFRIEGEMGKPVAMPRGYEPSTDDPDELFEKERVMYLRFRSELREMTPQERLAIAANKMQDAGFE